MEEDNKKREKDFSTEDHISIKEVDKDDLNIEETFDNKEERQKELKEEESPFSEPEVKAAHFEVAPEEEKHPLDTSEDEDDEDEDDEEEGRSSHEEDMFSAEEPKAEESEVVEIKEKSEVYTIDKGLPNKEPENHGMHDEKPKKSESKKWVALSVILALLVVVSIYTGGFRFGSGEATGAVVADKGISIILINDERCVECDTTNLVQQLRTSFPGSDIKELDYSEEEAKAIYEEIGLRAVPAVLFNEDVKEQSGYSEIADYLEAKGDYLHLKVGAFFNPEGEICDNGIDDNGDGKTDCDDEACSSSFACAAKKEKPEVELFVMSQCPYGAQMEKGLLPVMGLLKDKADIEIKFVNYAMRGQEEIDENVRQYCIQKEQNSKFIKYLKCYLAEGKSSECVEEAGVDKTKLSVCEGLTDAQFKISADFEDKSTWTGNYPSFSIHDADNEKYGVRGSPTLVINGVTASVARDSASLLKAVCSGFSEKPEECDEELESATPVPGFGFSTTTEVVIAANCAV